MSLAAAVHLLLHAALPALLALVFFGPRWRRAWLLMMAAMLVDADHLLADPIYDPDRCSIGLHPLHTVPFFALYLLLWALPPTRLVGLGLVLHMALDFSDCVVQQGWASAWTRLVP